MYVEHVLMEINSSQLLLITMAEQTTDLVKVVSECPEVEINIFKGAWHLPPILSFFPVPCSHRFLDFKMSPHSRSPVCPVGCINDAVLVKPVMKTGAMLLKFCSLQSSGLQHEASGCWSDCFM